MVPTSCRSWIGLCALAALIVPVDSRRSQPASDEDSALEKRLADADHFLSSDQCEGRGLGTHGLQLAADFIAGEFRKIGLRTNLCNGGPFQEFKVVTGAELGPGNRLHLSGPARGGPATAGTTPWASGKDFSAMSIGDSAAFDCPLVFAGYGITDRVAGYDDYAGLDVAGKAVIILRQMPQTPENSKWGRPIASCHVRLRHKVANAYEHGAAAVIMCSSRMDLEHRPQHDDSLPPLGFAGPRCKHPGLPVLYCRRAVLDAAVRAVYGSSLDEVEEEIDRGFTPHSHDLTGWRAAGRTDIVRTDTVAKNIVGVLPGSGRIADETIVVGAHYDHFGFIDTEIGGVRQRQFYSGADDNASGVASILEIARYLAQHRGLLARTVVFVSFCAEEEGLLGSTYYVGHPVIPLTRTVEMVNLDMVGRMRENKLSIRGSFTAAGWQEMLERINQRHGFDLDLPPDGFGSSDQLSFYAHQVPILHFFTGRHEDYHETSDKFERLNIPGMRRVVRMAEEVVEQLADAPARPEYVAAAPHEELEPFFGVFGDFTSPEKGYAVGPVVHGSPAARAGLVEGDLVVQLGTERIECSDDFDEALSHYSGGENLRVVARRQGKDRTFHVVLDPPGPLMPAGALTPASPLTAAK